MSVSFGAWMLTRGAIQAALGLGAVATMSLTVANTPTILSPKNGLVTKEAWIRVTGTGTPLSSILLYDGDQYLVRAEVGKDRKWSVETSFLTGKHQLMAAYELPNGRPSANSRPVSFEVKDLLAPLNEGLAVLNAKDGQAVKFGAFRLEGSAAPGRRLQVSVDGGKSFFKTAEEDGAWSFNIYLAKGRHSIKISTAVEPRESKTLTLIAR